MSPTVLSGSSWPLNIHCPSSGRQRGVPGEWETVWRWACVLAFCQRICVGYIVPVSRLINNVTARVATWPVFSQLTTTCQELLNLTQTNTAWLWFYSSHIKLFFWDSNLSQSLLICLAFSVPIRDSSPWQTNKPLPGVSWCQTAWRKQLLLKLDRVLWGWTLFPETSVLRRPQRCVQ